MFREGDENLKIISQGRARKNEPNSHENSRDREFSLCSGARGHQGAPGGSRLPSAPERVIKQQNNGPKPWFKAPKVCPDPKEMVFIHFWGIWGHLGAVKQCNILKTQYLSKV